MKGRDPMEEKVLNALPILRDLEEGELKFFLQATRRVHFLQGKTILKEGEIGETMYIIEDGTVEISKSLVMKMGREEFQDRDKILTRLSALDHAVIGEVALFEQGKRTATVTAVTDCVLLEVTRANFMKFCEANPKIGYKISRNIAQMLCSRLRKADEDTVKLTTALSIALSK